MRAIVLQHVPHEGPARILPALSRAGFEVERRELFAGARVPALSDADLLVVMGGPMGVGDVGDGRYPFLAREIELLGAAVARDFPTLGVCLGAQLLAAAAGARVYPNTTGEPPRPIREVGWGAVHFVRPPAEEPALAGLDMAEIVLHWHGDTYDLPRGATLLASTLACENQMYRLGRRQFGLQFHIELHASDVEAWLAADADYVRGALGVDGIERIRRDTGRFMPRFEERTDRWLDALVRAMTA
ncbi:MAG TPA: gamma-glutamyl-gamma-aminobutyrate hydrolase family protein [Polyangiaceae bacterium]|nr:gamma-glutamyl-gamma-aminobutyrate hydrolase family protein [Polyangiaceae bacterium]